MSDLGITWLHCIKNLRESSIKKRGGGGEGHFHICAYWVCAIFETPIFSPKLPLQSISFSQIKFKNPLRSITILEFLPFQRPSFSKFLYLQAVPSPPTAGLLRPARTRSFRPASRGYSRPECQPTRPTSRLQRPQFHARAPSRALHFHARAAPEPPIFLFAVAHTYQNVGRVPPAPRVTSHCQPESHWNLKYYPIY